MLIIHTYIINNKKRRKNVYKLFAIVCKRFTEILKWDHGFTRGFEPITKNSTKAKKYGEPEKTDKN